MGKNRPSTKPHTDQERLLDILDRFPFWPGAKILSALGHPGYGNEFSLRVIRKVASGRMNLPTAIEDTYHGKEWWKEW